MPLHWHLGYECFSAPVRRLRYRSSLNDCVSERGFHSDRRRAAPQLPYDRARSALPVPQHCFHRRDTCAHDKQRLSKVFPSRTRRSDAALYDLFIGKSVAGKAVRRSVFCISLLASLETYGDYDVRLCPAGCVGQIRLPRNLKSTRDFWRS